MRCRCFAAAADRQVLLFGRAAQHGMRRRSEPARSYVAGHPGVPAARRVRGVSVGCDASGQKGAAAIFAGGKDTAGRDFSAVHRQGDDGGGAEKIADIDDCMLSMEYHQLMTEELNGDYQRLKNPVVCRTALPETVRDRFLVFAAYGYEDFSVHSALEDEAETVLAACAPDTEPSAVRGTLWVMEHDADPIGCGFVDNETGRGGAAVRIKDGSPCFSCIFAVGCADSAVGRKPL